MIYEVKKGQLKDGNRYRRWFTCDVFDLFLWTDKKGDMEKFQICIKPQHSISPDIDMVEEVITWEINEEFSFDKVTQTQRYKTPILEKSEPFNINTLIKTFSELSNNIDTEIKSFINQKLYLLKDKTNTV